MNDSGKPRIGLLPLMLELYRRYSPGLEEKQKPFVGEIAGVMDTFSEVVESPVCAATAEVRKSVREFEARDVDMIVVLFVSYAASISALNPLLETRLPLVLFSTAPKNSMAEGMTAGDIMLNHGVHGYMDLANVLRRNGRRFFFVSGRKDDPRARRELETLARAARTAKLLRRSVIGLAGYTFDGMGDFGVDTTTLNAVLGLEARHVPLDYLADCIARVGDGELEREMEEDERRFVLDETVDADILRESNRVYLGLKRAVEEMSLAAFTMHFQGILEHPGIKTTPFLAISKLQELGMGYAGEGDLLGATANLMMRYMCGDTVFTETFCPDFDGGRMVMGHMGESNPAFGRETVLKRKRFKFGEAVDPVVADVRMETGRATAVNLGVVEDNEFQLVLYGGEICERIPGTDDIDMPFFHFKPDMELPDFLTAYGLAGGTHHVGMAKGDRVEEMTVLSEVLGIDTVILG